MAKTPPQQDWKPFAWQGIRIETPPDWSLGSVNGDARKGRFRLDDEELVRLEAQWERGRDRTDLGPLVENHIRGLQRAAKKQKITFRSERDVAIALPPDLEATCFEWRGDYKAYNLLTFCPECKRVLLVRVLARSGERLRPVAARVFESLRDHPSQGVTPWAVYGLELEVPERFALETSALTLQRIELVFRSGRDQAAAARFSLAEMQLRNTTLEDWFTRRYEKELRACRRMLVEEEEYRGHEALRFTANPGGGLLGLLSRPQTLVGRIWRCPEEDKILVARWRATRDRLEGFESFCGSVKCHE